MATSSPRTPKPTPFSFRNPRSASTSTPASSSSPSRSTSTSNTSNLNSNNQLPPEPLLPRHLENTYHRKLRALLQDHDGAIENWQEVVSDHGAKMAAALAKSWSDLESNYQSLQKLRESQISNDTKISNSNSPIEQPPSFPSSQDKAVENHLSGGMASPVWEAEHRIYLSLKKVDEAREESLQWRGKLQSALLKITSISTATEALLLEASKAKGLEFAFRDAMWGTWTFERFAATISSITSQHVLCSSHLLLLLDSLLTSSPLSLSPSPSKLASHPQDQTPSFRGGNDSTSTIKKKQQQQQVRKTKDELPTSEAYEKASSKRSSALEEWLKLRFVDQFTSSTGSKMNEKGSHGWFIEICEVEVGRWKEGK